MDMMRDCVVFMVNLSLKHIISVYGKKDKLEYGVNKPARMIFLAVAKE
jgi:hypothetical protein